MSQYVDIDGRKFVQLDDGVLVPVNVTLSLDGGTLVKLPPDQITQLQAVTLPATYPLPSAQVTDLKAVSVGNFPSSYSIGNFPTGFSCSNLPATYPLPNAQESIISDVRTRLLSYPQGSGALDASTPRVVLATNQPRVDVALSTATMAPIATTTAGDQTILTPTAGKALRITGLCMTAASTVAVRFLQGTVAQGQSNLSGAMIISDYNSDFTRAIALVADRSFVINTGAAIALNGYITWWEV